MKKLLTNNLSLKIVSVLGAVILWFLVTNIDDPVITRNFENIPVTITNGFYLESMGLTGMLSQTDSVKVTIEGNRSVVDDISFSDIVVTADLTQIVSINSDPVMVPITVSCAKYPNLPSGSITANPGSIEIDLEELKTESYVVTPSTGGTVPAKEYEVGEMTVEPEQITLTGPESLINKIDKVVAKVNVTNLSESCVLNGDITIVDKNQDELEDYQLSYLKIKEVQEDRIVDVQVTLWKLRTGVNIKVSAEGMPKLGYKIGEVAAVPAEISLVGTDEALALLTVQNNTIEIPASEVDASGKSEDFVTKIDISSFLPEGIRLATDVSSSVMINTQILPDGSKAFEVPISNITQMNLEENMMVSYATDSIEVRIKGNESVLDDLTAEDITGVIDLTELKAGQHTVPVELTVPAGLILVHSVMVDITIAETEITNVTQ